ncbi:metal-sensing transcriptional repressor [Intestinimonas sp. MSJ-38]|uniref:metal-sensing transcriptional repressor n=1 Tax=Intestinimonas sp. MSJ-38 TaxID=2841532 RepID=UPI000E4E5CB3|nr:metal-sensing transcriptional repressor [Intestinimonas sp. MSJ-38]MBU5433517.1 metal-sensing transcriptional repressor [Intestinimonas sp. MSJ-38]RHO52852.1 transcriptional regulator [Ruminococcaceae bacterium AM07-15]RHT69592.1 transcriptional regulator [Ruminococcaceae bacterium AM28-23LB]
MQADRQKVERLLKTARGQLDGILKMVEENRYCMDISNQIMATQAILHRVNREILQAHLQHCVRQSLETGEDSQQKIDELMALFDKAVF